MKDTRTTIFLLIILLAASVVRLMGLHSNPPSLYWEEAALGYDAYSIWKTGKDFHGNAWPIVAFESFGDYKPSGYFYVAAPFVGLLGLHPFSVRLPAALAGIATVYVVYLLGRRLFSTPHAGLLAAMALAIMPWHIQFSRAAFEVTVATFFLTLGIYWLTKLKDSMVWMLPGSIALVASTYTYHGLRVLAPLVGMAFVLMNVRVILRSVWFWVTGVVVIVLMVPLLANIQNPIVSQRFAETSLFSTSKAVEMTNRLRAAEGNSLLARVIHHRYWYWGREILAGMVAHTSPQFLFVTGDSNQRHQSSHAGLLYWTSLAAFIAVVGLSRKKDLFGLRIVSSWIVLALIPPALTNLTPHTLRFLPAAPAVALLVGFGLTKLFTYYRWQLFFPVVGLMLLESIFYMFDYSQVYPRQSASEWQYGYKEVVRFITDYPDQSLPVQVTRAYGRPSIYFLFYLGYDPLKVQTQARTVPRDQGELLAFDRYSFGAIDESKQSLAVSERPLSSGEHLLTIYFPNQKPAFYLYKL